MTKFFCAKYANSSGMMRNNGSTLRLRLAADSFQFILCVCFKVEIITLCFRFSSTFRMLILLFRSGFYRFRLFVSLVLQIPAFHVPGFTDSGFSCSGFYRFRLFVFRVLQIPAFHVPGFTDSGFSCSGFYRFRLFMFRVLQIPAFHVPGFLVPRSVPRSVPRFPVPFFYR